MSINALVRNQILAGGPDIASMKDYVSQHSYEQACEDYVDEQLNAMTHVELLERISAALESLPKKGTKEAM